MGLYVNIGLILDLCIWMRDSTEAPWRLRSLRTGMKRDALDSLFFRSCFHERCWSIVTPRNFVEVDLLITSFWYVRGGGVKVFPQCLNDKNVDLLEFISILLILQYWAISLFQVFNSVCAAVYVEAETEIVVSSAYWYMFLHLFSIVVNGSLAETL